MKLKYSLKGLDCANCAQKVQERVSNLKMLESAVLCSQRQKCLLKQILICLMNQNVEAVKSVEPDVEVINLSKNGQDYNVSNNHEECNG